VTEAKQNGSRRDISTTDIGGMFGEMEELRRFEGQVVLVTGGSRGIGAAIAHRFAVEGASVVIAANDGQAEATAAEMRAQGLDVRAFELDVTQAGQIRRVVDDIIALFGRIDVSIQNAGVINVRPLESLSEADWDQVLDVNSKGVFLTCQAVARYMKQRQYGRLINTASAQARQGFIYTPHYAASKFAVVGVTQALAKELAPFNITVNAFCPGIINTDMWAHLDGAWGELLGDYQPGELMKSWVENIPMRRAGTGEDVSGLVTFLASRDADYITGQTINVCGGMVMN